MPLTVRQVRLAGMEPNAGSFLLSDAQMQHKRRHLPVHVKQLKKSKSSELERKVEQLSSTVECLLPLLGRAPSTSRPQVGTVEEQPAPPASLSPAGSRSPPPDQEEVMSVPASDTFLVRLPHQYSHQVKCCQMTSPMVQAVMRDLGNPPKWRAQLDTPGTGVTGSENMFLRRSQHATLVIPQ